MKKPKHWNSRRVEAELQKICADIDTLRAHIDPEDGLVLLSILRTENVSMSVDGMAQIMFRGTRAAGAK